MGNHISNAESTAIYTTNSNYSTIANNNGEECYNAVATSSSYTTIEGNNFTDVVNLGILIQGTADICTIEGNTVIHGTTESTSSLLHISGSICVITGNNLHANTESAEYTLKLSSSNDTLVVGNCLSNKGAGGTYTSTGAGIVAEHNIGIP
jgi:parallel beta-helix repeat protein